MVLRKSRTLHFGPTGNSQGLQDVKAALAISGLLREAVGTDCLAFLKRFATFFDMAASGTPTRIKLGPYELSLSHSDGTRTVAFAGRIAQIPAPADFASFVELGWGIDASKAVVFVDGRTRRLVAVPGYIDVLRKMPLPQSVDQAMTLVIDRAIELPVSPFSFAAVPHAGWAELPDRLDSWVEPGDLKRVVQSLGTGMLKGRARTLLGKRKAKVAENCQH